MPVISSSDMPGPIRLKWNVLYQDPDPGLFIFDTVMPGLDSWINIPGRVLPA